MRENLSQLPGIYIHIPFCERKCGYCDFYSITAMGLQEKFVKFLLKEIQLAQNLFKVNNATFDTIYIGGGTPSVLNNRFIDQILNQLYRVFKISANSENTIELNPGAINAGTFANYLKSGINRLSIGAQSFNDDELAFLERIHNSKEAVSAFKLARKAGFDNISIDLIYALPDQKIKDWQKNIETALTLQPEHISAYHLTYESGTPFFNRLNLGHLKAPDENEERKFLPFTQTFLAQNGYDFYEISSYAKNKKFWSRHNDKYWRHTPYLAFGPSAHGYWENKRFGNHNDIHQYFAHLEKNTMPHEYHENIQPEAMETEMIMLSLRTARGLSLKEYRSLFHKDFLKLNAEYIDLLKKNNWIVVENDFVKLTQQGFLIIDEIIKSFK
jgi:oxygen-independent coproporphyrinogen-3 oxidase